MKGLRLVFLLGVLLGGLLTGGPVHAGSITPVTAAITPGDEGYALSAEFNVDLGARLEEAVARGVPLYFNLEFTLERKRWYWLNEQVAGVTINYKLAYNALTRHYRLSFGGLHQSFANLADALQVISRIASLAVADRTVLKAGDTYTAAVRLSLDRNQLPKPFQVDAIANRDWQVDAVPLRWQFVQGASMPSRPAESAPKAAEIVPKAGRKEPAPATPGETLPASPAPVEAGGGLGAGPSRGSGGSGTGLGAGSPGRSGGSGEPGLK